MPFPRALARFNRRVTNRIVNRFAGHVPGLGIIVHTGRRSGRVYSTPVTLFSCAGGYRVALTYGPDVDWLRNIASAGEFSVRTRGRTITVRDPVVQRDPQVSWAPPGFRQVLRAFGIEYYVQVRSD